MLTPIRAMREGGLINAEQIRRARRELIKDGRRQRACARDAHSPGWPGGRRMLKRAIRKPPSQSRRPVQLVPTSSASCRTSSRFSTTRKRSRGVERGTPSTSTRQSAAAAPTCTL